jgi:hypothetical protein
MDRILLTIHHGNMYVSLTLCTNWAHARRKEGIFKTAAVTNLYWATHTHTRWPSNIPHPQLIAATAESVKILTGSSNGG